MTHIKTYHRPGTVADALTLLARPGVSSAILAGGVALNPNTGDVEQVVDLQAVGLDAIEEVGDRLKVGAMVRIQALVDAGQAPELVRHTAHREGPNTFRNQGTVGGVLVSADPESELLAALLVFETQVEIQTLAGARTVSLPEFLVDVRGSLDGGIVTGIELATGGKTAGERVARTPADKPIVAVVGRKTNDGRTLFAACGVAGSPILLTPEQLDELDPPADFRGGSEYRKEMAALLAERVLTKLNSN